MFKFKYIPDSNRVVKLVFKKICSFMYNTKSNALSYLFQNSFLLSVLSKILKK